MLHGSRQCTLLALSVTTAKYCAMFLGIFAGLVLKLRSRKLEPYRTSPRTSEATQSLPYSQRLCVECITLLCSLSHCVWTTLMWTLCRFLTSPHDFAKMVWFAGCNR